MTTSQQTSPPFKQTREARPNEPEDRVVMVQNTALSESGDSIVKSSGLHENPAETIVQSKPAPRSFVYPVWPTSQPGPLAVSPPPGQHPHPLRTDQMVYESYDQEKGIPGIPRLIPGVQEQKIKPSPPDASCQNNVAEMDAIQHWLDDGGSLEKASSEDEGRDLPGPFVAQQAGGLL